jgi:uncharacterized membrane protein
VVPCLEFRRIFCSTVIKMINIHFRFHYFIALLYLVFHLFLSVISACFVFYFFPSLSIFEVILNGLEKFPEIRVSSLKIAF